MSGGPAVAVIGAGVAVIGAGIGAVVAVTSGTDPTVWTTGGIGSAAVGSLLYLIKRMTDGSLVSFKVSELMTDATKREDRLRSEADARDEKLRAIAAQLNAEAEVREQKLRDIAKRGQDREDLLWGLLKAKGAVE